MGWEKLFIPNREGKRLSALAFWPENEAKCLVVVAHGFRGSKENGGRIYGLADKLVARRCCLIAFDFSGSGESEGDFAEVTLTRQARDLKDVVDWACGRCGAPLVLLGRSFGGSTVLSAAGDDERVKGIALWSTPVFLQETFATIIPEQFEAMKKGLEVTITDEWGEFRLKPEFLRDLSNHNMVEYIEKVKDRPVLIVHGTGDEVVSPENARYLAETLGQCAELHLVEGSDHRFVNSHEVREDITVGWLEQNFLK